MARNGSGTFVPPPSNPVQAGTVIESDWANDTVADISLALTQSIAYDGQTVPINNLPMGGFRHTNVGDPVARNQYASLGMVQDGRHQRVNITSGVDNLIGTLVGGATAYVAGANITFFVPSNNTGAVTLNYNGIGARSLVSAAGLPLVADDLVAGAFVLAIYDGTQFMMLSQTSAATPSEALTANTTGQERPPAGSYPVLTIATGSTINVPAGSAWIVPPGGGASVEVTWAAQTIALQYLASAFSTTIAVDDTGTIVQFAGRMLGANLRNYARLGVVVHITGVASTITTRPAIFADDGYRGTDTTSLLSNSLINGGKVTPNSVAVMQLDISGGSIFMVGGSANTADNPNIFPIFQQSNIQFRTLAGQNTLGGSLISNAPVTSYDPAGAGTVVVLPNNNDTVIHRLYYMYGSFIWVYGQIIYSSVENALSFIAYDRSQYRPSQFLQDAVLVAEIVARKATTSLSILGDAAVVAPGGINFSIGSPGGIAEAPIDGTPYGRQNASWVNVLRQTSPVILNSAVISGPAPALSIVNSPVGPGTSGVFVNSGLNNWFSMSVVNPDDKAYFRSYDPLTGALRYTTTYDLATGSWNFPNISDLNGGQFAGLRNKFINGGMVISQRATSFPGVSSVTYALDRWAWVQGGLTSVVTIERNVNVPPDNEFQYSFLSTVTTADASVGAGDIVGIQQSLEGYSARDLIGRTFTISFWVRGAKAGIHCVDLRNSGIDRSYILEYTINTPNVWEKKSVTVPGGLITSGTWDWTNGAGLRCMWVLAAGNSFHNNAGAWHVGNWSATPSQVNEMDTIGNVFAITGVQLEVGYAATPFEHLPVGLELTLCRRFGRPLPNVATGQAFSASSGAIIIELDVPMRAVPTLSATTTSSVSTAIGSTIPTTISVTSEVDNVLRVDFTGASGLVAGNATLLLNPGNVFLSAEL